MNTRPGTILWQGSQEVVAQAIWGADLSRGEKTVLLAYVDHACRGEASAFPSAVLLAWKTGWSRRKVRQIRQRLLASGVLVQNSEPQGVGVSQTYRINMGNLPQRLSWEAQHCLDLQKKRAEGGDRSRRRRREAVLQKTGGRCGYCGREIGYPFLPPRTWHVDHMCPVVQEGSDDIENLLAACYSCNLRKGGRTVEEYRQFLVDYVGVKLKEALERASIVYVHGPDYRQSVHLAICRVLRMLGEPVFYFEIVEGRGNHDQTEDSDSRSQ